MYRGSRKAGVEGVNKMVIENGIQEDRIQEKRRRSSTVVRFNQIATVNSDKAMQLFNGYF